MKKNGINAFKGIEQSMYQIVGGIFTEDSMTASGQQAGDRDATGVRNTRVS